ncbi:hypothetical protein [Chryseobacterium sp. MFBS3-17]|uniref:hypothetical protein n=1 Tax=Chryseobacterium sp. MFBS3-17 TaxID=2886689 RepID=UPI001D0E401F|nr:hypothetical protein [Chryseobacterium sp. MFBS3-17]MCC2590357.1 hypothetical protein [Chryseobacterium sp. MFBS3-17]
MDSLFKEKPELMEYFQTSDKQNFYNENLARNHARSLKDQTVERVVRPAAEVAEAEGTTELKTAAADIIALTESMDLDTANKYLDAEISLAKPRKSVVEALENRINELENGTEDETED